MNSTAYTLATKILPKEQVAYCPIDFFVNVFCFLYRINPKVYIGAESEVWPCQVFLMRHLGMRAFLVNAGLSERSFRAYSALPSLSKYLFSHYDKIYTRSRADYKKFVQITCESEKVQEHWNLKFDVDKNKKTITLNEKVHKLQALAGNKPIVTIGSSHTEDETYLFKAISANPKGSQNYLFVLVPRHPGRKNHIVQMAQDFGLSAKLLSSIKDPLKISAPDLLIVDAFGILDQVYRVSQYCIVGGSFSKLGGHNPIEPALEKKAVFIGPSYHSFTEVVEFFRQRQCLEILPREPVQLLPLLQSFSKEILDLSGQSAHDAVSSVSGSSSIIVSDIQLVCEKFKVA